MGKIETVMKSEIVRLARKEVRAVCRRLSRDVRRAKRTVSQLRKVVLALEKVATLWHEQVRAQQALLQAPDDEVKAARFSPGLIRKLRTRLGLSQQELGTLVGVTPVSVGFWEQGKTRPAGPKRTALVALRKRGKREVRALLKLREPSRPKRKQKKGAKRPARKTGRRKRAR